MYVYVSVRMWPLSQIISSCNGLSVGGWRGSNNGQKEAILEWAQANCGYQAIDQVAIM